ncbi:MAG: hypothetical protein AAFP90_00880 [Planctomycetota bacterium]
MIERKSQQKTLFPTGPIAASAWQNCSGINRANFAFRRQSLFTPLAEIYMIAEP